MFALAFLFCSLGGMVVREEKRKRNRITGCTLFVACTFIVRGLMTLHLAEVMCRFGADGIANELSRHIIYIRGQNEPFFLCTLNGISIIFPSRPPNEATTAQVLKLSRSIWSTVGGPAINSWDLTQP